MSDIYSEKARKILSGIGFARFDGGGPIDELLLKYQRKRIAFALRTLAKEVRREMVEECAKVADKPNSIIFKNIIYSEIAQAIRSLLSEEKL